MSSIYLSLNKPINSNKFLNSVHQLITKYGNVTDCLLKIEIIKISTEYNNLIPKIEYKEDNNA